MVILQNWSLFSKLGLTYWVRLSLPTMAEAQTKESTLYSIYDLGETIDTGAFTLELIQV